MIFRREMANGLYEELTTSSPRLAEVNTLLNRRFKLPPISSNANLLPHENKSSFDQRERVAVISEQNGTVSLPQLDLSSLGAVRHIQGANSNGTSSTVTGFSNPSFPYVYSVLPPIGKKLTPHAPNIVSETRAQNPNEDNCLKDSPRRKRSTRKRRVQKQTSVPLESETVSAPPVVDTNTTTKIINKTTDTPQQENENSSIYTVDTRLNRSANTDLAKAEVSNLEQIKTDVVKDSATELNNIPEDLRAYADVYPSSPPPNNRRARSLVERNRQLLVEENSVWLSFMKKRGKQRRNATCPEIDEVLKNAVNLLREVFLRKTMEELCMVW